MPPSLDQVYATGKIYKIFSHINDCYYIGSTMRPLQIRLNAHRHKAVNAKVKDWIDDIGNENVKIQEISKFDNISVRDLRREEDLVIQSHTEDKGCLNCHRAYFEGTHKDYDKYYYDKHKDRIDERNKQYSQTHKDAISTYHKQYRKENLTDIKEKQAMYYINNKERLSQQAKEKRVCVVCGTEVGQYDYRRHERSKRHKLNLQEVKSI